MNERAAFNIREIADLVNAKHNPPKDPKQFSAMLGAFGYNLAPEQMKWRPGPLGQAVEVMTARSILLNMCPDMYKIHSVCEGAPLSTDQVLDSLAKAGAVSDGVVHLAIDHSQAITERNKMVDMIAKGFMLASRPSGQPPVLRAGR